MNQDELVALMMECAGYIEQEDKKIVTEVEPIRVIEAKDANKAFFSVEPGNLVYHTGNESCVIHLRKDPQR